MNEFLLFVSITLHYMTYISAVYRHFTRLRLQRDIKKCIAKGLVLCQCIYVIKSRLVLKASNDGRCHVKPVVRQNLESFLMKLNSLISEDSEMHQLNTYRDHTSCALWRTVIGYLQLYCSLRKCR